MGIVQRTINGRALFEAMKIGEGVEHLRGEWFHLDSNNKPTGGCAMGLMAINLGVQGTNSVNPGANLEEQLRKLYLPQGSKWNIPEYSDRSSVAAAIIYWNDTTRDDGGDGGWGDLEYTVEYVLTFEEVHQMVHDVLEPYFATEFVVDVWEFDRPNFSYPYYTY